MKATIGAVLVGLVVAFGTGCGGSDVATQTAAPTVRPAPPAPLFTTCVDEPVVLKPEPTCD